MNESIRHSQIADLMEEKFKECETLTVQQIEDRLRVKPSRVCGLAKFFKTNVLQIKNLIAESTKIRRGDAAWLRVWEPEP